MKGAVDLMVRRPVVVLIALAAIAAPIAAAVTSDKVESTVIAGDLAVANVVPTWGSQIPKIVYDGRWYYAATLDGEGSQYPWKARIWKSRNGSGWTQAYELTGNVYQPPGLLVDSAKRLHLQVGCYTGAECYPGVSPAPGPELGAVYTVRLVFATHLPDGSIDFSRFADHTLRSGITERYYQGLAVDPTRRFIYSAYAVNGWDLWFNAFDSETGEDVHSTLIGSPPAGRAWLYFRVQPGTEPGEVYVSFVQYVLGTPNSAYLDAVLLWRSTDGGRTFPEKTTLASEPNADGNQNWVDATDITVDSQDVVHAIFFKRSGGVSNLFYQRGMNGSPIAIGPLDNHAQIAIGKSGERFVFSNQGPNLIVARSLDGLQWGIQPHTAEGMAAVYWPNLLQRRSGSETPPSFAKRSGFEMMLAGKRPGDSAFTTLLLMRFAPQ